MCRFASVEERCEKTLPFLHSWATFSIFRRVTKGAFIEYYVNKLRNMFDS